MVSALTDAYNEMIRSAQQAYNYLTGEVEQALSQVSTEIAGIQSRITKGIVDASTEELKLLEQGYDDAINDPVKLFRIYVDLMLRIQEGL
jgi:hypothetical protein